MMRMGSIAVLLAIIAMPAQAQRQARIRGPAGRGKIGNYERPRGLSADAISRFRERLNLTEEQVESVKEAQRSDREARDALRLEMRGVRDRLRDDEITREEFREELAGRRSTARNGLLAYRETLESIFTNEQRSQMRGLRRQANRGQGVRGGRAGPGRHRDRGQASRSPEAQRGRRSMRPERGARAFGPPRGLGPRLRH